MIYLKLKIISPGDYRYFSSSLFPVEQYILFYGRLRVCRAAEEVSNRRVRSHCRRVVFSDYDKKKNEIKEELESRVK